MKMVPFDITRKIKDRLVFPSNKPLCGGGGGNQRVWRWGGKSKREKREKKKIWGKYNF